MSRKQHDVTIQETVNCINCALTGAVRSGVTDHCVVHQEVEYGKIQLTFAWKVTVCQVHAGQRTEERAKHRAGYSMNGKQQHSASNSAVVLSGIPAGFSYQSESRK